MDISGPSFCKVRNGKPCDKYLIITRARTPKGITNVLYFFDKQSDAEIYLRYLQQIDGQQFRESVINSTRTPIWEKKEYKTFKESIDWEELPAKVKNIKFIQEIEFTEIRARK